jgi:hypothetical protein
MLPPAAAGVSIKVAASTIYFHGSENGPLPYHQDTAGGPGLGMGQFRAVLKVRNPAGG